MANNPRFQLVEGSPAQLTYKWVGIGLFALFLLLVAFAFNDTGSLELYGNDYTISTPRLTKAIAFIICILGLQVVAGFTGQLSLGQGFFFGTGAYLSAWLVADHNWSWFATLIVVVPGCFLLGVIVGIPALRIKGLYLALVTLGLAAVFPSIVQLEALQPYTNGAGGLQTSSDLRPPDWLPLDGIAVALQKIPLLGAYFGDGDLSTKEEDRVWVFFLAVVLAAICFKLVSNLIKSRPGRALRAIRDNETSAAVTGMNLSLYKTMSFGLASALGGVGGIVYVAELGIASPGDFTQLISIYFIVGLVVGGVGTVPGAIIGGLVIAFIPEWASSTTEFPLVPERWLQGPTGPLIMGILLIVLTFVMPGGVVAGTRKLKAKVIRIVPRTPDGGVAGAPVGSDDVVTPEALAVSDDVAVSDG